MNYSPFRNSELTLLLANGLVGNSKSTVIVTLSPAARHFDTSFDSIEFALEVKGITLDVTANVAVDPVAKCKALQAEVDSLKKQLAEANTSNVAPAAPVDTQLQAEVEKLRKQLAESEARATPPAPKPAPKKKSIMKKKENVEAKAEVKTFFSSDTVGDEVPEAKATEPFLEKKEEEHTGHLACWQGPMQVKLSQRDSKVKELTAQNQKLEAEKKALLTELKEAKGQSRGCCARRKQPDPKEGSNKGTPKDWVCQSCGMLVSSPKSQCPGCMTSRHSSNSATE